MTLITVLIVAVLSSGYQKPDFSGTWEAEKPALNFTGVVGGTVIRIEQTADVIRIRRSYGREALTNPPAILTVRLDGSESPNPYQAVHRPGMTGAISSPQPVKESWAKR